MLRGPVLILQPDRCCTQWRSVFDNRISIVRLKLKPAVFIWCHLHDRKYRLICGLASNLNENYSPALLLYKCRHYYTFCQSLPCNVTVRTPDTRISLFLMRFQLETISKNDKRIKNICIFFIFLLKIITDCNSVLKKKQMILFETICVPMKYGYTM